MIYAIVNNGLLNRLADAALNIKFSPLRMLYLHIILVFSLSLYGLHLIEKLITFRNRRFS